VAFAGTETATFNGLKRQVAGQLNTVSMGWLQDYKCVPSDCRRFYVDMVEGDVFPVDLLVHDEDDDNAAETTSAVMPEDISEANGAKKVHPVLVEEDQESELHCICKKQGGSSVMIQCDGCNTWCHLRCVGIEVAEAEVMDTFACPNCTTFAPAVLSDTVMEKDEAETPDAPLLDDLQVNCSALDVDAPVNESRPLAEVDASTYSHDCASGTHTLHLLRNIAIVVPVSPPPTSPVDGLHEECLWSPLEHLSYMEVSKVGVGSDPTEFVPTFGADLSDHVPLLLPLIPPNANTDNQQRQQRCVTPTLM
jgi:hypothetical protein